MIPELLIPGVENDDETGRRPKVSSTHLDHGPAHRLEQECECLSRVAPEERNEPVWDGEDLMEIGNRHQILDLGLDPERLIETLALGTVTIATGVVERALASAVIAPLQTSTQSAGPTRDHVTDNPSLMAVQARDLS